jgi:hypothetical protein
VLFVAARNLLHAERRQRSRAAATAPQRGAVTTPDPVGIQPRVQRALASLSPGDREALMLVAFEDLTPGMAARVSPPEPKWRPHDRASGNRSTGRPQSQHQRRSLPPHRGDTR